MKQGNNQIMGIRFKEGLNNVETILFKFVQGNRSLTFKFPSENTAIDREEENVIDLLWTYKDTYMFEADKTIYLDTLVKMKNSNTTPEIPIKELTMSPTLFRQMEAGEFYD